MKKPLSIVLLLLFLNVFAQTAENKNKIQYTTIRTGIPMPDGDSLTALIIYNKDIPPQPAILQYSIYPFKADSLNCKRAVNLGYAGIIVYTRGKAGSKHTIEPFEHEAKDAYTVLDWISNQSWCDGRIGMYGGSYLGFSQWAAAKSGHPALKTIVPQVAVGIGVDFPMNNNIFMSYALDWLHYVTDNNVLNKKAMGSKNAKKWFKKGTAFKEIDTYGGGRHEVFQKWLQHPDYDDFWQKMIPYKEDFAKINIPVLTITGYYDPDQLGAMYYYREHYKYNPDANHYLIIGPYDHYGPQGVPTKKIRNYTIDSVAQVNFYKLPFDWFDYVLKGKEKPQFLKDKVNYQVMDNNEWRYASSLPALSNDTLTFYLSNIKQNKKGYQLATNKPNSGSITYTVDLKDHKETIYQGATGASIVNKNLMNDACLTFYSEPLEEDVIVNNNFSGTVMASINKKDMDVMLELYELKPDGTYFKLSYFTGRASYVKDRSNRKLLSPETIEMIPFTNSFMTGKKVAKGSKIVVTLGILNTSGWQVNYGRGKDVSNEIRDDAAIPLKIEWQSSSFIKVPVWKE